MVSAPATSLVSRLFRPLLPLATISLLSGLAYSLAGPFLSLFLITELDAQPFAVGAFLFTTHLAAILVSTVIGRLSDSRDIRRMLLVLGGVAGAAYCAVFALSRSYWTLLIVFVVVGAVSASQMPQMFAYARQSLDRDPQAPLAISGLRTVFSIAWVIGTPLAAFLIAESGFLLLYAASAVVYLGGALVAASWLRPLGRSEPAERTAAAPARGKIAVAAVAFVLVQAATSLGVLAVPLYVTVELGGTAGDAGLILSLCALLEIPLMIWFGWLATRGDHGRIVVAGAVTAIGYYVAMLMTSQVWQVVAAQALNAVVISAVMGVGISYFQDLAPDRPGAATTLYTNTAKVSAMVAGPLLGLAQHLGYRSAYAIGLGLSVIGLAFLLAARRLDWPAPVVSSRRG